MVAFQLYFLGIGKVKVIGYQFVTTACFIIFITQPYIQNLCVLQLKKMQLILDNCKKDLYWWQ